MRVMNMFSILIVVTVSWVHMSQLIKLQLQLTACYSSIKLSFKIYILLISKNSLNHSSPRKILHSIVE